MPNSRAHSPDLEGQRRVFAPLVDLYRPDHLVTIFPTTTAVHHQGDLNQEVTLCKPDLFALFSLFLFRIKKKKKRKG